MPTYEFLCTKCGRKKDVRKPISKKDEVEKCKCRDAMIRLVGKGTSFILKGKGFYCNREEDK